MIIFNIWKLKYEIIDKIFLEDNKMSQWKMCYIFLLLSIEQIEWKKKIFWCYSPFKENTVPIFEQKGDRVANRTIVVVSTSM